MTIGQWYGFAIETDVAYYFRPAERLKNGGWRGLFIVLQTDRPRAKGRGKVNTVDPVWARQWAPVTGELPARVQSAINTESARKLADESEVAS